MLSLEIGCLTLLSGRCIDLNVRRLVVLHALARSGRWHHFFNSNSLIVADTTTAAAISIGQCCRLTRESPPVFLVVVCNYAKLLCLVDLRPTAGRTSILGVEGAGSLTRDFLNVDLAQLVGLGSVIIVQQHVSDVLQRHVSHLVARCGIGLPVLHHVVSEGSSLAASSVDDHLPTLVQEVRVILIANGRSLSRL